MTNPDKKCLVCAMALGEELVWCVACDTPAHEECFVYNGSCAIYACNEKRFRRRRLFKKRAARWIEPAAVETAPPRKPALVVNFVSARELVFMCAGIVGAVFFLFSFLASYPERAWMMKGGLAALLAGLIAQRAFDDYHVVDGESGVIWLHRATFGFTRRAVVAAFHECREVRLSLSSPDKRGERHHTLRLVLGDERAIRIANVLNAPGDLRQMGERVAALIGKPLSVD